MTSPISIIALGIAILLLILWIFILERRIKKLMSGTSGASLEDTINKNQEALLELYRFRDDVKAEFGRMDARMQKKLHGARTVRFNPFAGSGSGGNQSFATALLNENGDGVVISSLYSRDKLSVFAKPIVGRKSEFELTDEERSVVEE